MISVSLPIESDATTGISFEWPYEEETTGQPTKNGKQERYAFGVPNTQFPIESLPDQSSPIPIKEQEELLRKAGLVPGMKTFAQPREELYVATHREELDGFVKQIVEDKAYVVFETSGGPLERAVKLTKLKAIHAHRQGALIRLVVEERGASTNVKFENLEEKGIATWREKIKDENLEKYDLLKRSISPRKPSRSE